MLSEIKNDLGANYKETTDVVLQKILDDMTVVALQVSNRTTGDNSLNYYIKNATKEAYLKRGNEGLTSTSEGSISVSYKDIQDTLRNDIIKNGLRIIK
jgi:hypothetical protein